MAAVPQNSMGAIESVILPDCPCFVTDINRGEKKIFWGPDLHTKKEMLFFLWSQELQWAALLTKQA